MLKEDNSTVPSDDDGWTSVQQRTFLRWMNMKLKEGNFDQIDSIGAIETGQPLYELFEVLSGNSVTPVYQQPKTRFQKVENLQRILDFIKDHEQLPLYNIGPEDIVDGNMKLILGLFWTIISKYSVTNDPGNTGKKPMLLAWVQEQTSKYSIPISNFSTSWSDGMAITALLGSLEPELMDYETAKEQYSDAKTLIDAVMTKAESVGISRLINADDMAISKPDEKSIMAYIGLWYDKYHKNQVKAPESNNKLRIRIETFIIVMSNIVAMKNKFLEEMENLIVKMANWMAQLSFSEDEFHSIEDVLRFRSTLVRYRTSGKVEIFKNLNTLRSQKVKLNILLRNYHFESFKEPQEKSLKKAGKLMKQLNTFELSAYKFVHEYISERIKELVTTFHKNAGSIQLGLNLIESELSEDPEDIHIQLNGLTEVMNDLKSLELMTQKLDLLQGRISSLYSRLDRVHDHFETDIKLTKFQTKISFLQDIVVDRLEFIDKECQNKDRLSRILQRYEAGSSNNTEEVPKEASSKSERAIFDKFDQGGKGYLNKAEFKDAIKYIYPEMKDSELGELFELIYDSKNDILRGVRFEEFFNLLKSTRDGNESKEPTKFISKEAENIKARQLKDKKLTSMTSDYYLKSFEEACNKKEFITKTDLENINVDDKLIAKVGKIMKQLESGENQPDVSFDYMGFFEKPENSLVFQDVVTTKDGEETTNEVRRLGDVLDGLKDFDISKV